MISIVITSFREPNIKKAIDSVLTQRIKQKYELVVAAPDKETEKLVRGYKKKHPQVKFFKDPGRGKSHALNLLFKKLKGSVWIFTDGDVFLDKNAVNEILKPFLADKKVGCVSGRPISANPRTTMLGYWAHLLADAGAHRIRKELSSKGKFFECTGYLFAFRKGLIKHIPVDVAEDSIIPFMIQKQGYKIKYAEEAKVYVKSPTTFKDFIKQRKRTADAHTKLTFYEPELPKVKTFRNEILRGTPWALAYPRTFKEFLWTLALFLTRFYIWISLFLELKLKKREYVDAWEKAETTR